MNPEGQNQQPAYYDANGQPVYANPVQQPVSSMPPAQPQVGAAAPAAPVSSHVTAAPAGLEGQSFDPQARTQYANEPGVVHTTRQIEPEERPISDELRQKHEESKRRYPHLNLSEGEVVILDIKRHPIGLLLPISAGGIVALAIVIALIIYPANPTLTGLPTFGAFAMIATLILVLVGIGTYIAVWVYLRNQFYMTNESVIQEIQHSLFSKHEQTVSLGSIEDASFRQSGILQTMLNYGTIRLSTEGEETTYRFAFVENPRAQVAVVNNGVEAFKNGRPVDLNGIDN